jgi:8-oxo-dGTP pyrophosphatase MutT (NUDIX family)
MRRVFTASCFIAFEGKVLLINHKFLGLWLPVGGELEPNESPMEGAYREAQEETRIHVEFRHHARQPQGTPPGFIGYEEHPAGSKGEHMNFCFLGHAMNRIIDGKLGSPFEPGLSPVPHGDGSWSEYRWVHPGEPGTYADLRTPPNVRDLLSLIAPLL